MIETNEITERLLHYCSVGQLVKCALSIKILIPFLLAATYICATTTALHVVGYWKWDLLWQTIAWSIAIGVVSIASAVTGNDERFFKKFIMANLKLLVLLEFVCNAHTFPLWVEMALVVPIASIATIMSTLAEFREGHGQVRRFSNAVLIIIGAAMLFNVGWRLFSNRGELLSVGTIRALSLPIVYSVAYLPILYVLSVHSICEQLAVRLHVRHDNRKAAWKCAWLAFRKCRFSRRRILRFTRDHAMPLAHCMTIDEVSAYIAEHA